jgi:hypothetical protein
MKTFTAFKTACIWEFSWSILLTVLVLWIITGKLSVSILTTLILAGVKAVGLTFFLKN